MKRLFAAILLIITILGLAGCGLTDPIYTTTGSTAPTQEATTLTVHFIDVGQADCALLECEGEYMLIDGGNVEDSSLVVSYLEQQGVTKLESVVCTHAHEDHVGGLAEVLATFETGAVYAPTRTYASNCFDDFVYYADQQGLEIIIPNPGDVIELGSATATVMGPVQSYADPNNTSIVLMVAFKGTRFLFTGDMETQAENDMLDYWGESCDWHADVLKVGHHGSDTSTGYRFLNEVMPQYGVISVGAGNSYGHPCEAPLSKLRDADVTVYRTDSLGTIVFTTDGTTLSCRNFEGTTPPVGTDKPNSTEPTQSPEPTEPQPSDTEPETTQGQTYIGNINSKKLHLPTCSSLPKEENRVYFSSYEDAIAEGYVPCSRCLG